MFQTLLTYLLAYGALALAICAVLVRIANR